MKSRKIQGLPQKNSGTNGRKLGAAFGCSVFQSSRGFFVSLPMLVPAFFCSAPGFFNSCIFTTMYIHLFKRGCTEKKCSRGKAYEAASRGLWRLAIKKIRGFFGEKPQDFFTKPISPADSYAFPREHFFSV